MQVDRDNQDPHKIFLLILGVYNWLACDRLFPGNSGVARTPHLSELISCLALYCARNQLSDTT